MSSTTPPTPPDAGSSSSSFFSKSGSIVAVGFGFVALAVFLICFSFGTRLHLLRREHLRTHPGQTLTWRQAVESSGGWWGWVGAERFNGAARARADEAAVERRRRRAERRKKLGALPVPVFWEVEVDEDGRQTGELSLGGGDDEDLKPLAATRLPKLEESPDPSLAVSYLIRMPTAAAPPTAAPTASASKQKPEFHHLEQALSSIVHHAHFADDDDDEDRWADLPYVELGITQMVPIVGDDVDDDEDDLKGRVEARRRAVWTDTGLEGLEGIQRVRGVTTGAD